MATPLHTLAGHIAGIHEILVLVARRTRLHEMSHTSVDATRLQIARMQIEEAAERIKIATELLGRVTSDDAATMTQVEGRA